jgi:hypothetical protein
VIALILAMLDASNWTPFIALFIYWISQMLSVFITRTAVVFCAILALTMPNLGWADESHVHAGSPAPLESLPEVMAANLIRVGVSNGPNFGHESTAATIVTRLRQLGYRGVIEVVYSGRESKQKLGLLLPPFDPNGGNLQEFPQLGLRVISQLRFDVDRAIRTRADLGIVGATDEAEGRDGRPTTLNVKNLLVLQPLRWERAHFLASLSANGRYTHQPLRELGPLGYLVDLPNPTDPAEFIEKQMSHLPELRGKIAALQALVANVQKNGADWAPAYGHFVKDGQALLYAAGLVEASRREPKVFSKPIVVPVFKDLSVLEWSRYGEVLAKSFDFHSSIKLLDLNSASPESVAQSLRDIRQGQVLVVNVGLVSKPVFDWSLKVSTLPPLVEGRNSMNVMNIVGRPYLPSSSTELYQGFSPSIVAMEAARRLSILGIAVTSNGVLNDGLDVKVLGEFFVQAQTRDEMRAAFEAVRVAPQQLEKDKLWLGLKATNERMRIYRQNRSQRCAESLNP